MLVATEFIATPNHIGLYTRRQIGLRVVLVHERDVIEHVFLLHQHLAHAVVDDHRHLARKRRVVGLAVGDGGGHQVAGAILVLQAFAAQGGAALVAPSRKPRARWSAAAQMASPTR
jgi:hypothetical protein